MSVVFPALSRPCCFEQRGLSVHRKKADSSHLSPTIERKRERDLRRVNDKEKREEKKKKHQKAVNRKKSAQTYQKQDLRVFLPQPQGGENVVEPIERPHDWFVRAFYKETSQKSKNASNTQDKKFKKTEVKKKNSLLLFKESDRRQTQKAKQKKQDKKCDETKRILLNGRSFLRGKISAPPRLPLLRRNWQGEEKERKSW